MFATVKAMIRPAARLESAASHLYAALSGVASGSRRCTPDTLTAMSIVNARESLAGTVALSRIRPSEVPTTVKEGFGGFAVPVTDTDGQVVDWALDPLSVILNGDVDVSRSFYDWRSRWADDDIRLPATLLDIPGIDSRWRQPGTVVFTAAETDALQSQIASQLTGTSVGVAVTRDALSIGAHLPEDNPITAAGLLWGGQEQTPLRVPRVSATWCAEGLRLRIDGADHLIGSWLTRDEQVWLIPPVSAGSAGWQAAAGRMVHGWLQAGGNLDGNFARTVGEVAGDDVREYMLADLGVIAVDVDSAAASVLWSLSPFTGWVHVPVDPSGLLEPLTDWLVRSDQAVSYTRL